MNISINLSNNLVQNLQKILSEPSPTLIKNNKIEGVLLSYTKYSTLLELLENLKDIYYVLKSKNKYKPGQGKNFLIYDRERTKRKSL